MRAPVLTPLRQRLLPKALSEPIKGLLKENPETPVISPEFAERLADVFDADLDHLGEWLGIDLNCENFSNATRDSAIEWNVKG